MTRTKRQALTQHIADHAADLLGNPDPVRRLELLRELRDLTEWLERETAQELRADGWTWAQVGNLTGHSRQAAQQRYGQG